ncbi:hypothetical protein [Vibrio navarrensis]|uniref:Uncharacterized protein n=1 Tax=Vibrio navarrensis TaxID=29495 RepID=A0AAJ4LTJ2_9VIBR|nr:hypothetical protein [Vibrio navarrensis]QPL52910.1 hypothetical protein I3X05_13000 [Vibrio navarrensis]QPL52912.1 hypothetical protein I3X05_13015 [Vibrio navarrensis]
MNIQQKRELARTQDAIIGVKEGMFVRFYNESLYGWNQWVQAESSSLLGY